MKLDSPQFDLVSRIWLQVNSEFKCQLKLEIESKLEQRIYYQLDARLGMRISSYIRNQGVFAL